MSLPSNEFEPVIPAPLHFIVVGGIDVTVEDLVAIWNGNDVLPLLSSHEKEIGDRTKFLRTTGENDPLRTFITTYNQEAEKKMRIEKKDKIKELIKKYEQKGQPRNILQMDRVLARLSGGSMQYDNVGALVAGFATVPTPEEASLVMETVREIHALVPVDRTQSHYVTDESARPLSSLGSKEQALVQESFALAEQKKSVIPIFLLERALVGHEPTNDDLAELTLYHNDHNVGSIRLVSIVDKTRLALFAAGILTFASGYLIDGDLYTKAILFGSGLFTAYTSALSHLIPLEKWKFNRKRVTSIDRYRAAYEMLCETIKTMQQTPVGKVRIMLLRELVRSTHQPDAQNTVDVLKTFVDLLNSDHKMAKDFDEMFSSIDRPWDDLEGILDAIKDFISSREELQ